MDARGCLGSVIAAAMLAAPAIGARAEGVYTCVDAKGRRLTSDRPIVECLDREQTVISPSGQVLRKVGPSLTADERAAEEEKAKRAADERNRQLEEKRRDRALLARYPDKATHDKERDQALAAVDEVIASANKRIQELHGERRKIETELEFYKRDTSKVPPQLKRRVEENDLQVAAQERFIANQNEEKKRIAARHDQEQLRLKQLWAQRTLPAAAAAIRSSSSAAR